MAVVPAGYADGLDVRLAGRGVVLVRGRRVPDRRRGVHGHDDDRRHRRSTSQPGDEVVDRRRSRATSAIDVREMAAASARFPWELLCRVGARIERVYESGQDGEPRDRVTSARRPTRRTDQAHMKPTRPSSSARSAAPSRRSGSGAARTAAPGTRSSRSGAGRAGGAPVASSATRCAGGRRAQLYADIDTVVAERLSTGIGEFDRVLGGGVVPGRSCCIGGEPGIGKSTLLLQAAAALRAAVGSGALQLGRGIGAPDQVARRAARRSATRRSTCSPRPVSSGSSKRSHASRPRCVIVDSIQTVFSLKLQSAPGSIGQVREAATQLLFAAKGQNVPTFLVGHVTKDGSLAGPKALEHIVDTVLYFEGERHHAHRVVRAVKNRFGAVSELGVFEMTGAGPAAGAESVGSCSSPSVRPRRRGRRCCAASRARGRCSSRCRRSSARSTYGNARRMASGLDQNRLVAAARRAREARRPEPGGRRCLRQRRRRHDRRRAGGRPGASWPRSRRACGIGRSRRARPSSARSASPARCGGIDAGGAAGARGGADGVHALRAAGGQLRRRPMCRPDASCVGVRTVSPRRSTR